MTKEKMISKIVTMVIYILLAMLIGGKEVGYTLPIILIRFACGYTLGSLNFHIANFFERLLG